MVEMPVLLVESLRHSDLNFLINTCLPSDRKILILSIIKIYDNVNFEL